MKKLALFSFVLVGSSLIPSSSTFACTPVATWPPSYADNLSQSDAAFIGTVQSVVQDKSVNGEYHITFNVDESLKGTFGDTVTVTTRSSSAACGYNDGYTAFKTGNVWAIYARGNATDGYTTNSLSLNTQYSSVAAAKDAVQKLSAPDTVSSVPTKDLTVGSEGAGVTWLQKFLISQNAGTAATSLGAVGATGHFGQMTRAALAEYQRVHGITPSAGYFGAKTRASIAAVPQSQPEVPATTFTGKIESVDTGCFADGTCSVTVDGKKVAILSGLRVSPTPEVGSLKGVESIGDLEGLIGKMARVFAAKTPAGDAQDYTLYGNADYYVELVGDTPANGKVTIRGMMECLPHMNPSGIQTLECAFGLKGDDGNHYALSDSDAGYRNLSSARTGDHVQVKGTFTARTSEQYPTIGTIEVTSISNI